MQQIILIAKLIAKEGKGPSLEEQIRVVAAASMDEPGCLLYAIHSDAADPNTFILIERWASKEALDKHYAMPHFIRYEKAMKNLVDGEVDVTFLKALYEGAIKKGHI